MDLKIICGLVLVACGGGTKHEQVQGPLGDTHDTYGHVQVTPAATDPARAARLSYNDPGGMWLPQQMTLPGHVETFKKLGVAIDPKVLADPLNAPLAGIVFLGGCTASFVSPEGLIVTNHHCAQGALQINTDKKQGANLVEDGFLAKTREDEKPAGPAQRVYVAQAFKDVTKDIRDGLEAIADPAARKDEVDKRTKALIAACERSRPQIRCSVKSYFRGAQYIETESLEIRDVRLVYAPARSVGNFGGEVDNWHWPRHTGDWSFFRAYVDKDGNSAPYSPDNVPYRPKAYLQVTTAGLQPGDFVMIAGYPGETNRNDTASEIHHEVDWKVPYELAYLKERYAMLDAHLRDEGETSTKATTRKQRVQNFVAKFQGVLDGMAHSDRMQKKDALDKKIADWAQQPGHEATKTALAKLDAIVADRNKTAQADYDRKSALEASKLLEAALHIVRWAEERPKRDVDRKIDYQERDLDHAVADVRQLARTYDRTLDRAELRLALVRALKLPEADRGWVAALLGVKPKTPIDEALIDKTLERWFSAPPLEDEKLRVELLTKASTAQLATSKDPFIQAALRVWPTVKAEEKKDDARTGELLVVAPYYSDAMSAVLGGQLAPDANRTLRITYGTVKPFKPGERAFTFAGELPAKDKGESPFNAPKRLLDAIRDKKFGTYADASGDVPLAFLSDLDITNGNSGSPVLNGRGELVGLAFDGTLAGVASDIVFDASDTRTISVGARYMIWLMDAVDGADHLVTEMGLAPKL